MSKHLRFSASAAYRWMHCPASYKIMKEAPYESNPAARLGTAVHAIIEKEIQLGTYDAPKYLGFDVAFDGRGQVRSLDLITAGEFKITQTEVDGAQICLNLVKQILKKRPLAEVHTEIKSEVISGELGGTSDIVIIDRDAKWGAVIDYKNGRGHVEIEGNEQLQIYAIGCASLFDGIENWTLAIVQPNDIEGGNPVRTWKRTTAELEEFRDWVITKKGLCERAYKDPQNLVYYQPGDHCTYCPAKKDGSCVAFRKQLVKLHMEELPDLPMADAEFTPVPLAKLTNEQLAWALQYRKPLIKFLDEEIPKEAVRRSMDGDRIVGFKVVESCKNRKLYEEALARDAEIEGWDIWKKERPLKTMGELEKEIPKDRKAEYFYKPKGDPEMAPEKDKRPALDPAHLLKEIENE